MYITELNGMHAGADPKTGDFSLASGGFRIVNGKKAGPIKGFTIAGNFFEMLKSVEAVADEVKFGLPSGFTCFGAPDTYLGIMSVAGK